VSVTKLTKFRNSEERQLCPYGIYVTLQISSPKE